MLCIPLQATLVKIVTLQKSTATKQPLGSGSGKAAGEAAAGDGGTAGAASSAATAEDCNPAQARQPTKKLRSQA